MKSFALASGSSGNCFCVKNSLSKYFLVDLGLSFKKTCEILEDRDIDFLEVDSIFITHEHTDHALCVSSFLKNTKACFYLTEGTFHALKLDISKKDKERFYFVKEHDILLFDNMKVFILGKSHDSASAVSFVFEEFGRKIGIFTDLGYVTDEIKHVLKSLDVIYFEANYCDDVIKKSDNLGCVYVNRIVSDLGHLSVDDSAKVLSDICSDNQKIVLSHISKNANTYENAYVKIKGFLNSLNLFPEIFVSFQTEASEWID